MSVKVIFYFTSLVFSLFLPIVGFGECGCNHTHGSPLPGRLGAGICYTEMGKTKIFFYMTRRKDEISRQLVRSISNNCIKIGTDVTTPPCPVSEISFLMTNFPETCDHHLNSKMVFDEEGRAFRVDPIGEDIFNSYSKEVIQIAETVFDFTITGLSRDINLIANQDAVKIHKDYFSEQYKFLNKLTPPIPKYYLFQDLTLIDWTMAKSSCSGTILQDRESGDRFLMIMFPGEVFGAIYMEPVVDKGADIPPSFPGPVAFPFHTAVAPVDFFGCCNMGSCKGKRVSAVARGIVLDDAVAQATKKATYLQIDRPHISYDQKDYLTRAYPNGILVKSMHTIPSMPMGACILHPDQENTTILEDNSETSLKIGQFLKNELGIKGDLQRVLRITKNDGGFSKLSKILPEIPKGSTIVIINRSLLPPGYKHFTLSEDCTKKIIPGFNCIGCLHRP